jgi:hypothetical protein
MFAERKIHRTSAKVGVFRACETIKILEKLFVMILKEEKQLR